MDNFFQDPFDSNFDWFYEDVPVHVQPRASAFVPYTYRPRIEAGSERIIATTSNSQKASKRMIEFLRRIPATKVESSEPQRERGHHHVINERMRRGREKQNYLALYSMLPPLSKSDKNSIVQVAAQTIQELECHKQEIERRNNELNGILEETMGKIIGGTKIKARMISHPISGIDYMLEALKCLKNTGSSTTYIQADFSHGKLAAEIDVDNDQMEEAELKKAVQGALKGVEEKLHVAYPGSLELEIEKPKEKKRRLE